MKNLSKNVKAKNCSKCHIKKKIKEFRFRSDKPGLHHSWCKSCEYSARKKYLKTVKGKKTLKLYNASDSRKNIKYKFNHSKKNKKSQAKYRKSGGYEISQRRYKNSPKGKLSRKINSHRRRTRLQKIKYKITKEKLEKLIRNNINSYSRLTCEYCKSEVSIKTYHLDHRNPISKNGTNHFNNLAISCKHCNLSKHNLTAKQFMLTRAEVLK